MPIIPNNNKKRSSKLAPSTETNKQPKTLRQIEKQNMRSSIIFTNLITELDFILSYYEEVSAEFLVELNKLYRLDISSTLNDLTKYERRFEEIIQLMHKNQNMIQSSKLTRKIKIRSE
ncbi:MAG: hypothetical protein AAF673_04720 [Pseudomonadota bacterium]